MILRVDLAEYTFENRKYEHHILLVEDGSDILISAANIYLHKTATRSIKTSTRYSLVLKQFFEYLLTKQPEGADNNFWRSATNEDIRSWQGRLVTVRDSKKLTKPSDKTIQSNAHIVYQFYAWASNNGFPVITNYKKTSWKFNFRNESKLLQVNSMISGSIADSANIDMGGKTTKRSGKKELLMMSNENIISLANGYKDPVYSVLLMLALATGLRAQGCVSFPYIGVGDNAHIRAYPDILRELEDSGSKLFSYTVVEKGSKERVVQVNMAAWKTICHIYLPYYYERKRKFEEKYPERNSNDHFFLKKNGDPVTEKNIADQTYLAKKGFGYFPWSFHSSRDWYATIFIITHLKKEEINSMLFNAAVEEQLREQLGHLDIKTTYAHYVRQASLVLALEDGSLDYSLNLSESFFNGIYKGELKPSDN